MLELERQLSEEAQQNRKKLDKNIEIDNALAEQSRAEQSRAD